MGERFPEWGRLLGVARPLWRAIAKRNHIQSGLPLLASGPPRATSADHRRRSQFREGRSKSASNHQSRSWLSVCLRHRLAALLPWHLLTFWKYSESPHRLKSHHICQASARPMLSWTHINWLTRLSRRRREFPPPVAAREQDENHTPNDVRWIGNPGCPQNSSSLLVQR
jgi:hypothetical protein